ncbi:hypothetical protein ABVK25_000641 [Lepraria finkii]|uniref:Rrp15p-domain-containing protein n=1 Tax=Lepraria finkii TaxID=1340010 RepID=A0ABR4BNH4_9LECA
MAPSNSKKRKLDDGHAGKPKKIRKQQYYSSPSASPSENEDDFTAVNLADSDEDADTDVAFETSPATSPRPVQQVEDDASSPSASDPDSDSNTSASQPSNPNKTKLSKQRSKRNDPAAFASSMSAILGTKLSTQKRADPVLARSATAAEANASISNTKLETKARHKLRSEMKEALEKRSGEGCFGNRKCAVTQATLEEEKRLGKIAQRGVLKLFNAVRQAQVRREEARKAASSIAGRGRREEKVGEMSKIGFLEMVAGGGKGKDIEEG